MLRAPEGRMPNPDLEKREVNLISGEFAACPQPVYRELVTKCPFARATFGAGPVLSRYEDVLWALRHPEIFSSEMEMHMALGTERPMIPQQIDPPAQTALPQDPRPAFSRKRMAELEPAIRAHAQRADRRVRRARRVRVRLRRSRCRCRAPRS